MRNIGEKITEITEQEAIPMGKPLSKAQQERILNLTLEKIGMAEETPLDGGTTDAMEQGEQTSRRIILRRAAQFTAAAAAVAALLIVLPKLGENKPQQKPDVPPVGTTVSATDTTLAATQTALASQTSAAVAVTSETDNQTAVTTTTEAVKPPVSAMQCISSQHNYTDGTKFYYTTESYMRNYDIWCYDTTTKQRTRVYTSERKKFGEGEYESPMQLCSFAYSDGLFYIVEDQINSEMSELTNPALFSYNPATGEKKKLAAPDQQLKSNYTKWFLVDNQFYFLAQTKHEDTTDFCRIAMDTGKLTVLAPDVATVALDYYDGYFYFGSTLNYSNNTYTQLQRISLDGKIEQFDRPALAKLNFANITISGDRIWWYAGTHKIYSSDLTFNDVQSYDEPKVITSNTDFSNIRSLLVGVDGNVYFTFDTYVDSDRSTDRYYDAFIRDERECTTNNSGGYRTVPTSKSGKYACEGIYKLTPDGKTTKIGSTAASEVYCILGDTIYAQASYFVEASDDIQPYTYSIQKDGSNEKFLFDNFE